MLVHDFVYIDAPAAAVQERVLQGTGAWLGSLATRATDYGDSLRLRLGPQGRGGRVAKEIQVQVGEPLNRDSATVIPLTWRASGAAALFPVFHGDLEIAALGDDQTQVSIWGHYDPPLGSLGETINKLALHRVAQASVRAFLQDVATALAELGTPAPC